MVSQVMLAWNTQLKEHQTAKANSGWKHILQDRDIHALFQCARQSRRATADQLTKFQPGVRAANFITNGPPRAPQNRTPSSDCNAQASHHSWQSTFMSPAVQRAQAMDYQAVKKCDIVS